uniref:Binding n=1 Tax=Arundo donax TaxID=35708 RepID=A0A0A9A3B6_ARUDO
MLFLQLLVFLYGFLALCLMLQFFLTSAIVQQQSYTSLSPADCRPGNKAIMDVKAVAAQPEGNANQEVAVRMGPDTGEAQQHEMKINWLVLMEVTFAGLARATGSFMLVLATVIVLGGYKWNLNPLDFWFVACLSIFQPYRIFGGLWWQELEILVRLPSLGAHGRIDHLLERLTGYNLPGILFLRRNLAKILVPCTFSKNILVPFLSQRLVSTFVNIKQFALLGLACVCMSVSGGRLIIHDFCDTNKSHEDINLNPVLNLFYSLVLAQAILSYSESILSALCSKETEDIRKKYKLVGLGERTLALYYLHVRKICRDGDVSRTVRMTLTSFALGTLNSSDKEVRLVGIQVLRSLLRAEACKVAARSEVHDSPDAIESLFTIIALTGQDDTSRRTRKEASRVIVELATDLRIFGFPRSVQSICSLLQAGNEDELVMEGLKILRGLSNNTDNLVQLSNSVELMRRITETVCHREGKDNIKKAQFSLAVIGKLARATGKQGIMIRCSMLENLHLMSTIREILQDSNTAHSGPRKLAIGVVSGFTLDSKARNCEVTRKALGILLSIFCGPHREAMPSDQVLLAEQVRLAAGKVLVGLTTESRANCTAILERGYLQSLQDELDNEQHTERRVMAANILQNICANLARRFRFGHGLMDDFAMANITRVLLKVVIRGTEDLEGAEAVVEAFLGLGLQLSKRIGPAKFNEALKHVGPQNFIVTLKSILEKANGRGDARRPGIRRYIIEQAIWMMQSEDRLKCIEHFVTVGMLDVLSTARETATMVENYKLEYDDIPVLEYEESISSLAQRAMDLIR